MGQGIKGIGELVGAGNDIVDGLGKLLNDGKWPDFDSVFSRVAAFTTIVGRYFDWKMLGPVGTAANFGALGVDTYKLYKAIKERSENIQKESTKLQEAINSKNADEIVESSLSLVTDIASIVAIFTIGPVKAWAIAIALISTAIKENYKNRKLYAQLLKSVSDDMKNRLKYDPKIYLNLPNSAIRCHVVNGCNMNRGLVYHGAFSQNRLQPHSWRTADNQHRTPTQRTLTADEMRIQQRLDRVVSYLQEHPNVHPEFEWKKPGVFELSTYPKR